MVKCQTNVLTITSFHLPGRQPVLNKRRSPFFLTAGMRSNIPPKTFHPAQQPTSPARRITRAESIGECTSGALSKSWCASSGKASARSGTIRLSLADLLRLPTGPSRGVSLYRRNACVNQRLVCGSQSVSREGALSRLCGSLVLRPDSLLAGLDESDQAYA